MRKIWISLIVSIMMITLVVSFHPVRAQEPPYRVIVNGQTLTFDAPIQLVNGRLIVPMRTIMEALEAELHWNGDERTVWAMKGNTVIQLKIGNLFAVVNGQQVELDAPAEIVNGRTLVPLRFISETLHADVSWIHETKTAIITTQDTSPDEPVLKTKEIIQFKWQQASPSFKGNPYITAPSNIAPYRPGKLQDAFIEDGVKMANFVRFLAGLPDDLTADPALNEQAQYGAVLLAAHQALHHTPPRPADMDSGFYQRGYDSTSSSNLSYFGYYLSGSVDHLAHDIQPDYEWTLAHSVKHYMRDEDDVNILSVGHRRWILNPALQKIGFGYSHQISKDESWNIFERYSTMQVFDQSRTQQVDYDFIAWPSEGYFPVEFFTVDPDTQNSDPWSISLNPKRYQAPQLSEISVRVTRISDGKSWVLDQSDRTLGKNTEYFHVNLDGYGIPYCIIFRPNHIDQYRPGDRYEVKIDGLKDRSGQPVHIQYQVTFFSLK